VTRLLAPLRFIGRELSPSRFPYGRFAAALIIGGAGGWLFSALALPLPWMLGSMSACTLAAVMRAPVLAPAIVRPPMQMVIGVMLGAGFSPKVVESIPTWIPTILGLALFIVVSGAACVTYFRRVAGFDRTTAYFSGMPGGLVEMVILGERMGGDARLIALIHSARVLLVVFSLPFLIQLATGVSIGARPQLGSSILNTPWNAEIWLIACGIAGAILGHLLRLPAALLLGPMLASAVVHVIGVTDFKPATEIVNAAQLVLGTAIGCRFVGTAPHEILRILMLSLGSTLILLVVTTVFAAGVSSVSDFGMVPLMLAYSPGGLAEMSLIALALQIEVAFIAAHHIIRVFLVMIGAGAAFKLTRGK
jgi:uncharacterized protein